MKSGISVCVDLRNNAFDQSIQRLIARLCDIQCIATRPFERGIQSMRSYASTSGSEH